MFKCATCGSSKLARVKPIKVVVQTRPMTYVNEVFDEELREKTIVDSVGFETVKEVSLCPYCAHVEGLITDQELVNLINTNKPDFRMERAQAAQFANHIHGYRTREGKQIKACKKDLADCKVCQHILKSFETMGLQALSFAIQDLKALEMKVTLGAIAFSNAMDRTFHDSKRAKADSQVALAGLKQYENDGGRI